MYNPVMTSMSASEARAALPELLNRVEDGEEVIITRHGRPVAVLVRPDSLRARRAESALEDAARNGSGLHSRGRGTRSCSDQVFMLRIGLRPGDLDDLGSPESLAL